MSKIYCKVLLPKGIILKNEKSTLLNIMKRNLLILTLSFLCVACMGGLKNSEPTQKSDAPKAEKATKVEASSSDIAEITIEKPYLRWLFGGFGFHNSEVGYTALMDDEFLNQRVLKTFREISPTFARVYAGFADISKEQMDRFADYYHKTFALADTTLYAVPGPMPAFADKLDVDEYAEKVAKNLAYLIKKKDVRKIRYYCLTNELMSGDKSAYFRYNMELFKKYNIALTHAFLKYGLDIWLIAPDDFCTVNLKTPLKSYQWCMDNMNDYVGAYCTHIYAYNKKPSDLTIWDSYSKYFDKLVQMAISKNRRYILGEWGISPVQPKRGVMIEDTGYEIRQPETATEGVLMKLEIGVAAMNAGTYACVSWSFVDYHDPLTVIDGHTPEARAIYESLKCGYRLDMKYNKWGLFRWNTLDRDYSAKSELYALGYLAKLFRKDATVLPSKSTDPLLRTGAIVNRDRSVSIVVINRNNVAKEVKINCAQVIDKPMRMYVYEADNVPHNKFNDLQPHSAVIKPTSEHTITVKVPARSASFFTTDYVDRVPPSVEYPCFYNGELRWGPSEDPYHCYYRVYKNGKQIASTVDFKIKVPADAKIEDYSIKAVDRWGNVSK